MLRKIIFISKLSYEGSYSPFDFLCENIAIQIALKRQKKWIFDPSPILVLSVQKYNYFSNWQNLFLRNEIKKYLKNNVKIYYSVR